MFTENSYIIRLCQPVVNPQEEALRALRLTNEKAVGSGAKLDIIFQQIRIGFFFADTELTKRNLEKAKV